jgi:hypothetical protein
MAPAKPRARAGGGLWKRHFRSEPRSRLEQNIRTDRVRKQTRIENQNRSSESRQEQNIRRDRVRKQLSRQEETETDRKQTQRIHQNRSPE